MKRSYVLKLIANQLDFLNDKFQGMRTDFTKEELCRADVILTTMEQAGMRAPERMSMGCSDPNCCPQPEGWENE